MSVGLSVSVCVSACHSTEHTTVLYSSFSSIHKKTTLSLLLSARFTFHSVRFNRFAFKIKWICEANMTKADTHTLRKMMWFPFRLCNFPILFTISTSDINFSHFSKKKIKLYHVENRLIFFFAWRPILVLPSVYLSLF